jgi:hypothetical protein|nr:MAG TPA: hypothetical protein [Caudoviricetes sp.]
MANYLDTGDTGRAVSAESDGALLAGIFGSAKYVLENGSQFKAEVQSNNIVKISDGDAVMYGRHVRIPANDSALVTINNGHSGTNRIDLIVFRYTKDSTGKEMVDLAVIQGEDSTGTATAPATIDGDILTGAMQADFPLYRVELNGLNIVSVTAMFDVIGNISQIAKANKDLTDKLGLQILLNTDAQQIYTMYGGRVKVVSGTKLIDVSRNIGYVRAFSGEELKALFGESFNATRLTVTTCNGDDVAQETHFYEPEIWKGEIFQYFYPTSVEGKMRINYKMEYVYGDNS